MNPLDYLFLNQQQGPLPGAIPMQTPNQYGWQQLQALNEIDAQEPSYLDYGQGPVPSPQPIYAPPSNQMAMGGPQVPVSNGNAKTIIQQQLGALEPPKPDTVSNILSGRFQQPDDMSGMGTSYGDYSQGVISSALGKPVVGPQFAEQRQGETMKRLMEMRKLEQMAGRGNLPAPLQLANEYQKARAAGDTQRMADLSAFAKIYDKGVTPDAGGGVTTINNYGVAAGGIKGAIKGAEEDAKNASDIAAAAPKAFNDKRGAKAGENSVTNEDTMASLDTLDNTITEGRAALKKTKATGPLLGPGAEAINDPEFKNLQGHVNALTLQAKDLFNLGSGQGFSDNDLKFLKDVTAGKYARADTISYAFDRMENLSEKRRQFLSKRNQSYNVEFGYQPVGGGNQQPSGNDAYAQAQAAIAKGANPQAVAKRLQEAGYDPSQLGGF